MCRYASQAELRRASDGADHELVLPEGETVVDGEWLLAIIEVGRARRATAAAARAVVHGTTAFLLFEPRDWERIADLAGAPSVQAQVDDAPLTDRSPTSSRRGRASTLPRQSLVAAPPNARVLLVDDDEGIREVVGAMLEAVGLSVTSVVSGEQALEKLVRAFDLVVLDWTLPGIGGLELCREIRKNQPSREIPILFLTANASSKDVVAAFAAGADDYVVKPFRAPELGARIFGLLRRARMAAV